MPSVFHRLLRRLSLSESARERLVRITAWLLVAVIVVWLPSSFTR
ncbi:hypothetical protein [Mycobacterium asiaticum]|nr:hypothetical protein [Mycobacterium asiaticum]